MTEDLSSYEDFYRLLYADYEEAKGSITFRL